MLRISRTQAKQIVQEQIALRGSEEFKNKPRPKKEKFFTLDVPSKRKKAS